eukprot:341675-Pyramimonas_sp.AAC.2
MKWGASWNLGTSLGASTEAGRIGDMGHTHQLLTHARSSTKRPQSSCSCRLGTSEFAVQRLHYDTQHLGVGKGGETT